MMAGEGVRLLKITLYIDDFTYLGDNRRLVQADRWARGIITGRQAYYYQVQTYSK